jgi:hypothetical protein
LSTIAPQTAGERVRTDEAVISAVSAGEAGLVIGERGCTEN